MTLPSELSSEFSDRNSLLRDVDADNFAAPLCEDRSCLAPGASDFNTKIVVCHLATGKPAILARLVADENDVVVVDSPHSRRPDVIGRPIVIKLNLARARETETDKGEGAKS